MRGEFQRADGLLMPNNLSLEGVRILLAAACRNDVPTFYAGLVTGAPTPTMTLLDMVEPTVGVNGYQRIAISRDAAGWPTQGESGGERFISTDWLTWVATGAGFDKPIQRVALFDTNVVASGNPVLALSASIGDPLVITPDTPLMNRRFKYTLFA